MTQNPSNNITISGPLVVRMLDEANGYLDEHRAEIASLKAELSEAKVKIEAHEMTWKTAQHLLSQRNEEINSLESQLALYKQEFNDASNQHLHCLYVLESLKKSLENILDSVKKEQTK